MAEKISRSKSPTTKAFISRAAWLPQDWQREFDRWVEEISLLLISHNLKTFSDDEWLILDPIQDEARQAKRQNNMLGYRAALRKYGDKAKSLLLRRAEADAQRAGGDASEGQGEVA